jgi:hypothetical protein
MKNVIHLLLSLLFGILYISTPLYAGTETLVTTYPSPSGNYNRLQTNSILLKASTLSVIQAKYKCSYDPAAGLPPCPAGLVFFDTDSQAIYVSVGTHWRSVNSSCVPLTACSSSLNCGSDSCGISCGACLPNKTCSSSLPGTPGSCY